jgi:hypothetical protein
MPLINAFPNQFDNRCVETCPPLQPTHHVPLKQVWNSTSYKRATRTKMVQCCLLLFSRGSSAIPLSPSLPCVRSQAAHLPPGPPRQSHRQAQTVPACASHRLWDPALSHYPCPPSSMVAWRYWTQVSGRTCSLLLVLPHALRGLPCHIFHLAQMIPVVASDQRTHVRPVAQSNRGHVVFGAPVLLPLST